MRILEKEMALREETRVVEQTRPAVPLVEHFAHAVSLGKTQAELSERVTAMTQKVRELPQGDEKFAFEIALFKRVRQVMGEVEELLVQGETGPETIAAETEVIELLLQTRRVNPKSKGGAGGSAPGGGGTGDTDRAALALIGRGDERNSRTELKTVRQTTGTTGTVLPAEFRSGLDTFFEALERDREQRFE